MLFSFERPARYRWLAGLRSRASTWRARLFADLENCTVANVTGIWVIALRRLPGRNPDGFLRVGIVRTDPGEIVRFLQGESPPGLFPDHRQDSKGTWWMPWHQESMKGVNGCDKPR